MERIGGGPLPSLCYMKVEAATAREQATPLAARIKELEEELTRVAGDQNTFRS